MIQHLFPVTYHAYVHLAYGIGALVLLCCLSAMAYRLIVNALPDRLTVDVRRKERAMGREVRDYGVQTLSRLYRAEDIAGAGFTPGSDRCWSGNGDEARRYMTERLEQR